MQRKAAHVKAAPQAEPKAAVKQIDRPYEGRVYCPICTHTVDGTVRLVKKRPIVVPGQKCSRCASALDAGIVLQILEAA
jgi:hypothetical protein